MSQEEEESSDSPEVIRRESSSDDPFGDKRRMRLARLQAGLPETDSEEESYGEDILIVEPKDDFYELLDTPDLVVVEFTGPKNDWAKSLVDTYKELAASNSDVFFLLIDCSKMKGLYEANEAFSRIPLFKFYKDRQMIWELQSPVPEDLLAACLRFGCVDPANSPKPPPQSNPGTSSNSSNNKTSSNSSNTSKKVNSPPQQRKQQPQSSKQDTPKKEGDRGQSKFRAAELMKKANKIFKTAEKTIQTKLVSKFDDTGTRTSEVHNEERSTPVSPRGSEKNKNQAVVSPKNSEKTTKSNDTPAVQETTPVRTMERRTGFSRNPRVQRKDIARNQETANTSEDKQDVDEDLDREYKEWEAENERVKQAQLRALHEGGSAPNESTQSDSNSQQTQTEITQQPMEETFDYNMNQEEVAVSNTQSEQEIQNLQAEEQEAQKQEQAKLEAQQKAEEQAKLEAQQKAEEQEKIEAQKKAEEQAKLEVQQKAEEQAKLEAQKKAEEQAKLEAQQKAEEQAKLEAQRKAEEQAKLEAQRKAEEEKLEAQRKAEAQAKLEAQRKVEEQARSEQQRLAEEAKIEAQRRAGQTTAEAKIEAQKKPEQTSTVHESSQKEEVVRKEEVKNSQMNNDEVNERQQRMDQLMKEEEAKRLSTLKEARDKRNKENNIIEFGSTEHLKNLPLLTNQPFYTLEECKLMKEHLNGHLNGLLKSISLLKDCTSNSPNEAPILKEIITQIKNMKTIATTLKFADAENERHNKIQSVTLEAIEIILSKAVDVINACKARKIGNPHQFDELYLQLVKTVTKCKDVLDKLDWVGVAYQLYVDLSALAEATS